MNIMQIVGIGMIAAVLAIFLRQTNSPVNAVLVSLLVGVIIFVSLLDEIAYVLGVLDHLAVKAQVNQLYLTTILKIIGIAYVAEFGAQVCRDAGETAIAARIEFAAKILILVLAVPILAAVLETIIRLLP
ncbi:MAG TPA: stage III sporulation protein AD [Clostridia bacterium]|nr:stage III sporulation protein AD [Clostridia bacterium]